MSDGLTRMYEGMFLVDAADAVADWDGVLAAVNTTLSRANAEVVSVNKWDERRLAYPIGSCKRGTYILSYFRAEPTAVAGIERDVVLSETLVRAMVLRADKMPQTTIDADTPAVLAERQREASEARAAEAAAGKAAEAAQAAEAADSAAETPAEDAPVVDDAALDSDATEAPAVDTIEPVPDVEAVTEEPPVAGDDDEVKEPGA